MTGSFDVLGWALPLARRVLYCWLRTSVFPEDRQQLGLDPGKRVCYVLQDHRLSNRLVLFAESQRAGLPPAEAPLTVARTTWSHAVFSLNGPHSRGATARQRYAPAPLMRALLHDTLSNSGPEVQIVPVVILWGRAPDKQESILKALFSETWRRPGPFGRLLTILLHGRNVLVRFNPPILLSSLIGSGISAEQATRKLSRVLRVHFGRQRRMAIGPDLSHRNTQIEALLAAEPVQAAIRSEAATRSIAIEAAERRARRFALEIASDYSYATVRALELFLSWLWNRLYDAIEIHNVDVVTRIAPSHGIVYVPTHRSHVDYLLLSHSIHRQGLTPPHIAAGANLNMFLVGPLLRRCGAFFLRRSFKGEALYTTVFHEYLHLMLTRGFPLKYFIEGGRSRSGRTLTPKAGILGMTVRSFIREHERPLVFVPVYVGYERVIEGRTYVRELAGKPKQRESLWGVLKSARRIKKVFGTVHINFGEPLALAGFLEAYRPGWATEAAAAPDDWARAATHRAASELARRLNAAAVVNPVNLIALALLANPRHTADEQALLRLLAHYAALSTEAPYAPATVVCPLDPRQIVAYVERMKIVERIAHPLGDLIRVPDSEAPLLAYFRNNVLHLYALPALVACLLHHNHSLGVHRVCEAVAGIYDLMCAELFLHWTPDELPAATAAVIDVLLARGLLRQREGEELCAPEANSQEFVELGLLGATIRPTLERHFLTLALLEHVGSGCYTQRALESDCHLLAQRLALLYEFNALEQPEITSFSALIAQLIDVELLREDETGLLHFDARITIPLAHAELVLPAEARQTIRRMASATR